MGLKFQGLYKGGNLPAANSSHIKNFKQLNPQSVQFLLQIGLTPKIKNGHARYWR